MKRRKSIAITNTYVYEKVILSLINMHPYDYRIFNKYREW